MDRLSEPHVSLIRARYWPKATPTDTSSSQRRKKDPRSRSHVSPGASFSFFLGRKRVIITLAPTFGPTYAEVQEYINRLQQGLEIHDDGTAAMPLEDVVFRRVMQNANPDGSSSCQDISDILNVNIELFLSQLTTPPMPTPTAHVSEYQSLHELL